MKIQSEWKAEEAKPSWLIQSHRSFICFVRTLKNPRNSAVAIFSANCLKNNPSIKFHRSRRMPGNCLHYFKDSPGASNPSVFSRGDQKDERNEDVSIHSTRHSGRDTPFPFVATHDATYVADRHSTHVRVLERVLTSDSCRNLTATHLIANRFGFRQIGLELVLDHFVHKCQEPVCVSVVSQTLLTIK